MNKDYQTKLYMERLEKLTGKKVSLKEADFAKYGFDLKSNIKETWLTPKDMFEDLKMFFEHFSDEPEKAKEFFKALKGAAMISKELIGEAKK